MKFNLVAILLLFFISCSDDDRIIDDLALEGDWVLSNVICFCSFTEDVDFSLTTINFDPRRGMVTVDHESDYEFFRKSGEHFYGGQANRINFSDGAVFFFETQEDQLTLTFEDNPDIADDEVTYIFNR